MPILPSASATETPLSLVSYLLCLIYFLPLLLCPWESFATTTVSPFLLCGPRRRNGDQWSLMIGDAKEEWPRSMRRRKKMMMTGATIAKFGTVRIYGGGVGKRKEKAISSGKGGKN